MCYGSDKMQPELHLAKKRGHQKYRFWCPLFFSLTSRQAAYTCWARYFLPKIRTFIFMLHAVADGWNYFYFNSINDTSQKSIYTPLNLG
jgi:hypothetical protein